MDFYKKFAITFISALLITVLFTSYAETREESPYRFHELTIYVIPSTAELDWTSPATLYQTYRKSLFSTVLSGSPYSMGHLFIQLTSPLLEEPIWAGMGSVSRQEQKNWVFKEKAGLGVLGVGLMGKLENRDELSPVKNYYIRKNSLSAITYRLGDNAAEKILRFIEYFDIEDDNGHLPSLHYGGAFWPLYEKEGAGCTAFGIAMLELAGVSKEEMDSWKHEVNIPMSLIGGELNPGNKVKVSDIKNANSWYIGPGEDNIDFVKHSIYDPSLIYNWIMDKLSGSEKKSSLAYYTASTNTTPRLFTDIRDIEIDSESPIFLPRYDENLFIYHFLKTNGLLDEHAGIEKKYNPQP
jgi:hypothetical protein